ncbi:MAG: 50S ribosomal protein L6 [Candidatus Hydrothermarchaeales archaeon]
MLYPRIKEVIVVPEEVSIDIADEIVTVKGPIGEVSKRLHYSGITLRKEDNSIIIETGYPKKTQRALVGTFASHINNMITGVTKGFEYKLKVVYAHFPMSVKVVEDVVKIENFLGEGVPRKAKIVGKSKVMVKGGEVIVNGIDLEDVSQTATNIEQATIVKKRDRRVFQDGIYLVERNGVPIR